MAVKTISITKIPVVLGAMTFGKPGKSMVNHYLFPPDTYQGAMQARVHDIKDVSSMIDLFRSHGHNEIDTARVYGKGSSEEYLGQLQPTYTERGIIMATKLFPNNPASAINISGERITHSEKDIRLHVERSLKALGV